MDVKTPPFRSLDNAAASLFEPVEIAGLDLPNRFAMAPMTRERSHQGVPDATVTEYYRRRAAGGIGLLITEGVAIDHATAVDHPDIPRLTEQTVPAWAAVVAAVHAAGSKIIAQLWHKGSERSATDGLAPWTPSGVREDGTVVGQPLTATEIGSLIGFYADAARLAERAGFDGVEVHSAHGYLLDEFLWSLTNRREAPYGGSIMARARLLVEIVAAIRSVVGPRFVVGVRYSQFKERDFGAQIAANPKELEQILQSVTEAGVDLWHVSTRRVWEPAFDGSDRTLSGWTKDLTGKPVIGVGSVGLRPDVIMTEEPGSLLQLVRLLDRGEFDLLALGRALLANPGWVADVAAGETEQLTAYQKSDELIFP